MITIKFVNGRKAEFDYADAWEARGFEGVMYIHVLDDDGCTIQSYPLDDIADIED